MARFTVVVSDQVFPTVDIERSLLAGIDAELVVASSQIAGSANELAHADAILNTYLPFDADAISNLERCRVIARYGIGVDNIDLTAAAEAGIVVTNVPDYSVEEVAAHGVALVLATLRKVVEADAYVRAGNWDIGKFQPIRRLSTLTVGLVGYGRIARKIAEPLRALGARIVAHDPYLAADDSLPPLLPLNELIETSDVISLHVPLTDDSRGMVGREQLAKMKSSAILVNTSRGPLVDLDAVIRALERGQIAGAGLDVFDTEPLDSSRIEGVPNLIVTPHMAYYSEEALQESQTKAATQIVKVLTGNSPDYQVN